MNLFCYFIFVLLLILFSFIESFLILWLFFELSLFLGLVLLLNNSFTSSFKQNSLGPSQLYFFWQILGSLFLLLGGFIFCSKDLMFLGFLMKLGLFPFLWWFPFFSSLLSWSNLFMFLTMMKLYSLWALTIFFIPNSFLFICLFLSILFSMVNMFYMLNNFKNMIMWSSVIDSVFLMILGFIDISSFFLYFLLYTFLLMLLCKLISNYSSMETFNKVFSNYSIINFPLLLLVILGVPPFMGFFYKLIFFKKIIVFSGISFNLGLLAFFLVFIIFCQSSVYFLFFLSIMQQNFLQLNLSVFNILSFFFLKSCFLSFFLIYI